MRGSFLLAHLALAAAVSWLLTSRYLLYSFTCRSVILLPGTQFPSTFTSRAHCSHASGTARSRSTGQDSCRQPVRLIVAGHVAECRHLQASGGQLAGNSRVDWKADLQAACKSIEGQRESLRAPMRGMSVASGDAGLTGALPP